VAVAWVDSVSVRFLVCALWMGILLQRQPLGPANIPPGDLDIRRLKERGRAHWHGSSGYVARCGMVVAMVLQCICPGPGLCLPPEHLRVRTAVFATSQWPHDTPQLPFHVFMWIGAAVVSNGVRVGCLLPNSLGEISGWRNQTVQGCGDQLVAAPMSTVARNAQVKW
jgi:hypothetical protein